MNLIPYETFHIITKLEPEEIYQRLKQETTPVRQTQIRLGGGNIAYTIFMGFVSRIEFELQQVLSYTNSFAPVIIGTIERNDTGTDVKVRMKLSTPTKIFMGVSVIFLTVATISIFYQRQANEQISATVWIPIGMIVFCFLLSVCCFNAESGNAKNQLINLLDGGEI